MAFKIGEFQIDNPIVLAPMAGISNVAFRTLVKTFGAGLIYAEMVSDKAVVFQNEKTLKMLKVAEEEHPMSLQIFGAEKKTFVEAARYVERHSDCDIIDINMGCPVPKITKNEAGAKLLLDEDKIYDIVSAVVKSVDKPVTVKMRIGWDDAHVHVVQNAKAVEAAGAQAVAIHGRTAKQMYTGKANWQHIADAKAAVNIPVIGNGDVKTPEDAKRMLEETGCDGVMIGRAVLGNPWLIKQTADYLATGTYEQTIPYQAKFAIMEEHLARLVALKGEKIGVLEMRGHLAWYVKGLKNSVAFKKQVQQVTTVAEINEQLTQYKQWLDEWSAGYEQ